jgi:hypothetical protein
LSVEAFQSLVNRFWFRQTQIARKVIRCDLLVAFHLCLMALEDCCVLAMLLRDRSTGTSVHNDGGMGNELVVQIQGALRNGSRERILECETSAGDVFEQFAKSWSADYKARCPEFREWISRPI